MIIGPGEFSPLRANNEIRDDATLTATQKLVAYTLISRASSKDDGEWTWSQRRIAKDASIARSTMQAALAMLVQRGKVSVRQRTVGGTNERDVNTYRIEVGRLPVHVDRPSGNGGPIAGQQVDRLPGRGGPIAGQITEISTDHLTDPSTEPLPRQPEKVPKGTKKAKTKTSCPPSDATPEEVTAWCQRWEIPAPEANMEAAKLLDHFRGKGEAKLDWGAVWRNWNRNAPGFAARGGRASAPQPPAKGRATFEVPEDVQ
jgi:hypothetical protein